MDLLYEIFAALSAEGMDPVECFRRCVTVTNDWKYNPAPPDLRDRFEKRLVQERAVPIVKREIHEMLNPQPRASAVIHRLLDYIDRADLASQRGEPKPPFVAADGMEIFPSMDDDLWWLSDMQRKTATGDATTKPLDGGDEDGPFEEEAAQDDRSEVENVTSDEDPLTSNDEGEEPAVADDVDVAMAEPAEEDDDEPLSQSLDRPPSLSWHSYDDNPISPRTAAPYFEKQPGAHCGMHSLNNAIGFGFAGVEDMQYACDDFLERCRRDKHPQIRAEHAKPTGWYSPQVLCHALNQTSLRRSGSHEYTLGMQPLVSNPDVLRSSVGALMNIGNRHWIALKYASSGHVWQLDSQELRPISLSWAEYKALARKHHSAFPILNAADAGAAIKTKRSKRWAQASSSSKLTRSTTAHSGS